MQIDAGQTSRRRSVGTDDLLTNRNARRERCNRASRGRSLHGDTSVHSRSRALDAGRPLDHQPDDVVLTKFARQVLVQHADGKASGRVGGSGLAGELGQRLAGVEQVQLASDRRSVTDRAALVASGHTEDEPVAEALATARRMHILKRLDLTDDLVASNRIASRIDLDQFAAKKRVAATEERITEDARHEYLTPDPVSALTGASRKNDLGDLNWKLPSVEQANL